MSNLKHLVSKGWRIYKSPSDGSTLFSHPNFDNIFYSTSEAMDLQLQMNKVKYIYQNKDTFETHEQQKLNQVLDELHRANKRHGEMGDPIEGLHTLKCEVAELEREMMRKNKSYEAYRLEMVQVAAMGLKLLFQCGTVEKFEEL